MLRATVFIVLFCLIGAAGSASTPREVLSSSSNPEALEQAASALAHSSDPRDLDLLGQFLRDAGFLSRLDPPRNPTTYHLGRVMTAMAEHPTVQAAKLCLILADDPVYLAEGDRQSLLLQVLAAVKPMSERAAALFQRTNEEGYFAFNAPSLAANGSPRALALFESMMLDRAVPIGRRVDCLHSALVPRRTELQILHTADRILSRTTEHALAMGLIESVFDYQSRWFGRALNMAQPPAWQGASADSLRFAAALADKAMSRRDLNPALRETVGKARETIAQSLAARQK